MLKRASTSPHVLFQPHSKTQNSFFSAEICQMRLLIHKLYLASMKRFTKLHAPLPRHDNAEGSNLETYVAARCLF